MKPFLFGALYMLSLLALPSPAKKPPEKATPQLSPLEQYVLEVKQRSQKASNTSLGSLFSATGRLADGVRDVRASQVFDLVTIVVLDNSSAVSTGTTNTQRKSSAQSSITSLLGPKSATG